MTSEPMQSTRFSGLIFLIATAGGFIALALYLVLNGKLNADEGFYLQASKLVQAGFRPYKDFGFTQGPLLPYVDVPWLQLFGYDLTGQRLTSFAWLFVSISVGVGWLLRLRGPTAATLFLILLIGSPNWMAYMVKGKTYAFASLAVTVGVAIWFAPWSKRIRWSAFVLTAGLGLGARYPLAAFFLPAALIMLLQIDGARAKVAAIAFAFACAACELYWFGRGAWDNFYFWTVQFHRESLFAFSLDQRFGEAFRSAPGLWIFGVLSIVRAAVMRNLRELSIQLSLLIGVLANLCTRTTYAEYAFPFVPALAMLSAESWRQSLQRGPLLVLSAVLLVFAGWSRAPDMGSEILVPPAQVAAFLKSTVPTDSVVVASMPEIPVAAGLRTPLELAMGKFSLTEEMDPFIARKRLMVTPDSLCALMQNPSTQAVVLSMGYNWSFYWSVPSYRPLSSDAQELIRKTIATHFRLAVVNAEYIVYIKKNPRRPISAGTAP